MKEALQFIIDQLVSDPKQVKIAQEEQNGVTTFTVAVAKEDIGKVIGKEGRIIRAVRNVMKIPAIKQGKRISIVLEADNE